MFVFRNQVTLHNKMKTIYIYITLDLCYCHVYHIIGNITAIKR